MLDKNILINIVKEANLEVFDYYINRLKIEDYMYTKTGFGGDKSLKIDLIFEDIFIKHLKNFGNILSEECGFIDNKKDITFVIDPLDGSNNFYSNLPYFGTSVAIRYKDKIVAGFVCNLATKTMIYRVLDDDISYFSLQDKKYFTFVKNDKSKVAVFERAYKYPDICQFLNSKSIKFRVLGATALSLASAVNYDFVLFKGNIREFDVEAGLFISKDLYIHKGEDTIFVTNKIEKFEFFKEFINQF